MPGDCDFLVFYVILYINIYIYIKNNPKEVKLLTRLRLDLSHLRERKFKLSFQDSLKLISS